jgi:hypothetical protein
MVAVAVASYGDKYVPMLLSFLESWGSAFSDIYLAVGEVSDQIVEDIGRSYPSVHIISTSLAFSHEEQARISEKMRLWRVLADHPEVRKQDFTIFADADTVLVGDMSDFCEGDVVITLRVDASRYLINTGIVGLSRKALDAEFVRDWSDMNEAIIADSAQLARATSPREIFGGGDQMALIQMLGISRGDARLDHNGLDVRLVECDVFNACENQVDPDRARVLHLKAALHKFLLERKPLIGERRLEDSLLQLRSAIQANEAAIGRMRSIGVPASRIDACYRMRLPRGTRSDLSLPLVIFSLHRANALARRFAGAILSRLRIR